MSLAETGVPTDYGAAPKDARVQKILAELDALAARHKDYGLLELERGRVLLIVGRAEPALRRSSARSRSSRATPRPNLRSAWR